MSEESSQPERQTPPSDEKPKTEPATESAQANTPSPGDSNTQSADQKVAEARNPKSKKPASKKPAKKASKKSAAKSGKPSSDSQNQDKQSGKSDADEDAGSRNQVRRGRTRGRGRQQKESSSEPNVKLNSKLVAKRAWKIFVGEVTEEGLALIADKDARELARRSLRVAEIYSREEAASLKNKKAKKKKPDAKKEFPQSHNKGEDKTADKKTEKD